MVNSSLIQMRVGLCRTAALLAVSAIIVAWVPANAEEPPARPAPTSDAPSKTSDDPFDDLLRDLKTGDESGETAETPDKKPTDPGDSDSAPSASNPLSAADAVVSLYCEGTIQASGQFLSMNDQTYAFSATVDLGNEEFEVSDVEEGDFFEADETYDIKKVSRRYIVLEADYSGRFFEVETLKLDRRTLELSGDATLANGYEPRFVKPEIDITGDCELD